MNVALHGLETAITTAFPVCKDGRRWQPRVMRFADDLVVFHRDSQALVQVQDIASKWLQEMGFTLQPSKTRLEHTLHPVEGTAGFDFLSFHVRQYPVGPTKTGKTGQGIPPGFKTFLRPSTAGRRRHLRQIHEEVRRLRTASQEGLIKRLNPIIPGWSNYDATVASKTTFVRMDTALYANLRRWAHRRQPNKSAWWISEKSWHPRQGQGTFKTTDGRQLRRHSATAIRR
jgi:RNA-directed DNA polymerase